MARSQADITDAHGAYAEALHAEGGEKNRHCMVSRSYL